MKTKPDRDVLIETLDEIVKRYPPNFFATVENADHDIKTAFRELIGQHEEVIQYPNFLQIYVPGKTTSQIADDILQPRRKKPRSISKENKILFNVDNILNNPEAVTDKYQVDIDKQTFCGFLRMANNLRTYEKSLDEYFSDLSDKKRTCIAESLGCLYETNIFFRTELYKKYQDKAKTAKKMPELEEYHSDAHKLVTMKKGGKQITQKSIEQDIQEFRDYLIHEDVSRKADKELYDVKRFRYLAYLIIEIGNFFNKGPKKLAGKKISKRNEGNVNFSIDRYLDDLMSQARDTYAVLSVTLPLLHCEGEAITQ